MDVKIDSNSIVESISAEDIGKLPRREHRRFDLKTAGYQAVLDYIKGSEYPKPPTGTPPANAFTDLMNFADVARNGGSNVTFVPSFADAVKP